MHQESQTLTSSDLDLAAGLQLDPGDLFTSSSNNWRRMREMNGSNKQKLRVRVVHHHVTTVNQNFTGLDPEDPGSVRFWIRHMRQSDESRTAKSVTAQSCVGTRFSGT